MRRPGPPAARHRPHREAPRQMTADPAAGPPGRPRRPYPYPRALQRAWRSRSVLPALSCRSAAWPNGPRTIRPACSPGRGGRDRARVRPCRPPPQPHAAKDRGAQPRVPAARTPARPCRTLGRSRRRARRSRRPNGRPARPAADLEGAFAAPRAARDARLPKPGGRIPRRPGRAAAMDRPARRTQTAADRPARGGARSICCRTSA